jgi:hypothetical protein
MYPASVERSMSLPGTLPREAAASSCFAHSRYLSLLPELVQVLAVEVVGQPGSSRRRIPASVPSYRPRSGVSFSVAGRIL